MNTKTRAAKPASFPEADAPQAFREMAEKGTTQAKETYEKMSADTTEAADLMNNSYLTAVKGMQDYNNKEPLAKFIDRVIFPPLEGASLSPSVKPEPA